MKAQKLWICLVVTCGAIAFLGAAPTRAENQTQSIIIAQSVDSVKGVTINGRLDSSSQTLEDGQYYNVHTFEGREAELVTIELIESELPAILVLLDPDGNGIGGSTGDNSRITVTLPITGTYKIVVVSSEVGASGNYTLSRREPSAANNELAEAEKLNQQVVELYQQGKYKDAISLAQKALAIREKVLGSEHPDVATSLNNLALLYQVQGNYSEAEPLYQRSLAIREKVLGSEHPSVATSLNNLAALYGAQGNYSEAEPLYQRSLAIREKVLGSEHPSVATSLNNLAALYEDQGNYSEAEPLYQRSLAIWEKVLGSEHPDVATSLNNLAALYKAQGNYSEAETIISTLLGYLGESARF